MDEEAGFIAALVAEPSDRTVALVFADWLDERGDPRGAMLRIDEVRAWMAPDYGNPVPKLRAALEGGKRITEASKALALIGEPAVPELVSLLSHGTAIVRARAARTIRMMGPRAKAALPALLAMVKDPDYTARSEAAQAAKAVVKGGHKDTATLREALHDKDSSVRHQAAALLGTMRAKRSVKNELAKGLDSPDPTERLATVEAMANLRTKTAADALCKALADPADEVRLAAAKQLGWLASPTMTVAVEPLRQALADRNSGVRDWATTALGKIGPAAANAVPDLLQRLPEVVGRERGGTVGALLSTGGGRPDVLDVVLAALRDPDGNVRYLASAALTKWKTFPASAAPALREFVRTPHGGYRSPDYVLRVRAGLRALARIPGPPPEVWEEFRSQLAGDNADIAAEAVAEIGPPAVVLLPDLVAALSRAGSHWWPQNIAKAIGRLGDEGVAALVKALDLGPKTGPNPIPAAAAGLKEAGPAALPALPALLARLRQPAFPYARGPMIGAIAAMGPGAASAVPDLVAMFLDDAYEEAVPLLAALGEFGPAVLPFVPKLTEVLRRPARSRHHASITSLLADLMPHGAELLSVLRDVLRRASESASAHPPEPWSFAPARAAVAGLAELGPAAEAALPELVLAYQTFDAYPPGDLRDEVLAAYGKIGAPAIPHIRAALRDPAWPIRRAALEALGTTGDTSAETVAALRAAETDAAKKVRACAAAVLKQMERAGKRG